MNGICSGFWTLFLTTTSEQFGTNLRTTATTTVSNFVRASVIVYSAMIGYLKPILGFLPTLQAVALFCFALAAIAIWKLPETFNRDLDFVE
jgi:hypothetical protein